jgi:hypothetical protein
LDQGPVYVVGGRSGFPLLSFHPMKRVTHVRLSNRKLCGARKRYHVTPPREARCVHRRVRLVVGDSDSGVVAVVETVGEAGSATVVPRVDVRIVGG